MLSVTKIPILSILLFIGCTTRPLSALEGILIGENSGDAISQTDDISDVDILHAIEREFRSDDALDADLINVTVREGVVTLGGEAKTVLVKRQAERMVGSLKGVRSIINQLTVFPSLLDNETIREQVQAALNDSIVKANNEIVVDIDGDGVVKLSGNAVSYSSKLFIDSIVADVRGVTDVVNQLAVKKPASRRDPEEIKAEIIRRYELSPFLAEGLITISVDRGIVKLSGKVGSVNERLLATNLAWLAGVEEVVSEDLKVDPSQKLERRKEKFVTVKSDLELKQAVEDALLYDWRVRNQQIDVSAN
ncbi:MAG: BON domain-containing protein, partial [Planctomycetota bacterium]